MLIALAAANGKQFTDASTVFVAVGIWVVIGGLSALLVSLPAALLISVVTVDALHRSGKVPSERINTLSAVAIVATAALVGYVMGQAEGALGFMVLGLGVSVGAASYLLAPRISGRATVIGRWQGPPQKRTGAEGI